MRKLPRVLVVEDEPSIAELIAVNLRHNGFAPTVVFDGAAAQREVDAVLPDVILLDWMLPGESGASLARQWRKHERTKTVPILMLTARSDESDKVQGLDAGADDYVTKPFSPRELIARVRALLRRRDLGQQDAPIHVQGLVYDPVSHHVSIHDQAVAMGPTEFRLLGFFLTHQDRVYSRDQILNHVWGGNVYMDERTVDVHIRRLRKALGDHDRLVQTVRGAGYRFSEKLAES